jgi:hypothetical protein
MKTKQNAKGCVRFNFLQLLIIFFGFSVLSSFLIVHNIYSTNTLGKDNNMNIGDYISKADSPSGSTITWQTPLSGAGTDSLSAQECQSKFSGAFNFVSVCISNVGHLNPLTFTEMVTGFTITVPSGLQVTKALPFVISPQFQLSGTNDGSLYSIWFFNQMMPVDNGIEGLIQQSNTSLNSIAGNNIFPQNCILNSTTGISSSITLAKPATGKSWYFVGGYIQFEYPVVATAGDYTVNVLISDLNPLLLGMIRLSTAANTTVPFGILCSAFPLSPINLSYNASGIIVVTFNIGPNPLTSGYLIFQGFFSQF